MKVTPREMVLFWGVALTALLAISFWFCAPKVKMWQECNKERESKRQRIKLAEYRVSQRGACEKKLQEIAQKLTKYPADQDVTADYLKILENIVRENNVTLSQRRPQKEKKQKDLYEFAIDCTWEADLGSMVHFLYALEQQKVTMDMGDLNMSLQEGGKGKLNGSFSLICLYTRTGDTSTPAKARSTGQKK